MDRGGDEGGVLGYRGDRSGEAGLLGYAGDGSGEAGLLDTTARDLLYSSSGNHVLGNENCLRVRGGACNTLGTVQVLQEHKLLAQYATGSQDLSGRQSQRDANCYPQQHKHAEQQCLCFTATSACLC